MKRQCPNCNGINHAKILYGLPVDMREIEYAVERKEIVLLGFDVSWDDPKWKCNDCFTRF